MTSSSDQIQPAIDHVVINVMGGLDEAAAQYIRLGFQLTERGHHSLGSSNNLAIFRTDYLELVGFLPGNETKRADLWTHPAGLTGLVFKSIAPDIVYQTMRTRGVPIQEPMSFQRPVTLPDGSTRDARFGVVRVSGEAVQNGRTFFCHHHTPELVWRPEWQVHRNGVVGVAEFVIASQDPSRTVALYEQMFGADLTSAVRGGRSFKAGEATVLVLQPAAVAERYQGAAPVNADGSDRMVGLAFFVSSLDAPRAVFDAEGIPYTPLASGGIVVPHAHACNVALAFVERSV
jgi:hypothetical protein